MGEYSLAEAREKLPALLEAVERGERVTITRDGAAVAELRALAPKPVPPEAIDWLERELADIPFQPIDSGTFVRRMRDGDEGF